MSGDSDQPDQREIDEIVARANKQVRERDECQHCGGSVPNEDFTTKYAAAGGALAGPFCSEDSYWGWMNA